MAQNHKVWHPGYTVCLGSIVPQNVLKQHILLPAKSEWLRFNDAIIFVYPHPGQSVSVKFLQLTCSNGIIIVRMPSLGKVLGNGFASWYRIWLCFTFCAQSISLDRQNALDSLNWILVLKHIWQKKQSQSLINGHFNPWSKYYILYLFIKTTFELPTCV